MKCFWPLSDEIKFKYVQQNEPYSLNLIERRCQFCLYVKFVFGIFIAKKNNQIIWIWISPYGNVCHIHTRSLQDVSTVHSTRFLPAYFTALCVCWRNYLSIDLIFDHWLGPCRLFRFSLYIFYTWLHFNFIFARCLRRCRGALYRRRFRIPKPNYREFI